jgi:cytidylate kinase
MAVVTISREYGSAGREVARKAADLLGYHLVDKAFIGKVLAGYGLIDFDQTYEAETSIWSTFDTRIRTIVAMLERIAFAVARHGHSVILGRGSYVALSGLPGVRSVLNVRLRAPFDWRVDRVMREEGLEDRLRAEAVVREGDKVRSSFLSSVYGIRWDSMERFDLIMDTSKIGIDRAAAWIDEAVRQLPSEPAAGGAGLGAPDSVLDEAIAAELGCKAGVATGA